MQACLGGNVAGALHVVHVENGSGNPVEPNTGETIALTGTWATPNVGDACSCSEGTASVSVDVDWNGSSWVASCTGCDATNGPIFGVTACAVNTATGTSGHVSHSSEYYLVVEIADVKLHCAGALQRAAFLNRVDFTLTQADDGDVVDLDTAPKARSVAYQSVSATTVTDYGAFECTIDCNATGPQMTLYVQ